MKKILLPLGILLCTLFVGQNSNAQTNGEVVDFYQSIFGMGKKAIVSDLLQLKDSDPFWAVYDEYETKRKELGKERLVVLAVYIDNYNTLDDDKSDALVKLFKELRKDHDKLVDKYYKKVKKSSGSKVAAQFFQLEFYFLSEIRAAILEEIPFIGEFDE